MAGFVSLCSEVKKSTQEMGQILVKTMKESFIQNNYSYIMNHVKECPKSSV